MAALLPLIESVSPPDRGTGGFGAPSADTFLSLLKDVPASEREGDGPLSSGKPPEKAVPVAVAPMFAVRDVASILAGNETIAAGVSWSPGGMAEADAVPTDVASSREVEAKRDVAKAVVDLYVARPPVDPADAATRAARSDLLANATNLVGDDEPGDGAASSAKPVSASLAQEMGNLVDNTMDRFQTYFQRPTRDAIAATVRDGANRADLALALARYADEVAGGPPVLGTESAASVRSGLDRLKAASQADEGGTGALLAEKRLYRATGSLADAVSDKLLASGIDPDSLAGSFTLVAFAQCRVLGAKDAPVATGYGWAGNVQLSADRVDLLTAMARQVGVRLAQDPASARFVGDADWTRAEPGLDRSLSRYSRDRFFDTVSNGSFGLFEALRGVVSGGPRVTSPEGEAEITARRDAELAASRQRDDLRRAQGAQPPPALTPA